MACPRGVDGAAGSKPGVVPGGDAQLLGDQVEPGHQLGHRVLDLQAGVHLQEHELVAVDGS